MERRKKLLIKLINSNNYLSSAQLSSIFSVSTKTIFNDLNRLKPFLNKYDLKIQKKPGSGVKITGTQEQKGRLKAYLAESQSHGKNNITGRQVDICLYTFVHESYIKDIAARFFISRSTVSRDINQINTNFLSQYNIRIKNLHETLKIEGNEVIKRKALSKLIFMKSGFGLEDEILKTDVPLYINKLFNIDLNPLIDFINQLENDYDIKFTIEAKKNLLIHLAISVKRIKLNKNISSVSVMKRKLQNYSSYLPILRKDIVSVEKKYHIMFTEPELYMILLYIFSSKVIDKSHVSEDFMVKTKKFISRMSEATSYNYSNDLVLLKTLSTHLEVAGLRIDFGLEIYNPFQKYVLEHDLYLFIAVQDNIGTVFNKKVPDSEIAFIVTHFLASKERMKTKKNVLIVCSSGIGISSLLEQRIKNNFPQYNVVATASISDIKKYKNINLIISTVNLKNITDKDFVVIKPFDDINNISDVILQSKGKHNKVSIRFSQQHSWFLKKINDKEHALEKVSNILAKNHIVSSDYLDALIKREKVSSTYIGDGVALVHGVYKRDWLVPSLNVFKLDKKVKWSQKEEVDLLINFVATEKSENDFKLIFQRIGRSIDDIQFWNKIKKLSSEELPKVLNERFDL